MHVNSALPHSEYCATLPCAVMPTRQYAVSQSAAPSPLLILHYATPRRNVMSRQNTRATINNTEHMRTTTNNKSNRSNTTCIIMLCIYVDDTHIIIIIISSSSSSSIVAMFSRPGLEQAGQELLLFLVLQLRQANIYIYIYI